MTIPIPNAASLRPIRTSDGVEHVLAASDVERIWSNAQVNSNGCWVWTASRFPSGYGQTKVAGLPEYAHRVMYMAYVGAIPKGMHTDHLCRNKACCNPDHLEVVTARENVRRSPVAPAAINARKTHCIKGHPLAGENLFLNSKGRRVCRTCQRDRQTKAYAAKKARNSGA